MAIGSGTGTPAAGAGTFTLADIRDRLRTMLESAAGTPEPLAVLQSTETLTTLTDRIETRLQDSGNVRWSASDIQESIEQALEQWSRHDPAEAETDITLSANGREVDISSITGLVRVNRVWWPYDSTDPGYPPAWVQFQVWPGSIVFVDETAEPQSGEKVRIYYSKMHTLDGLNAESTTTLPAEDIGYFINGAAGFAAQMRAVEIAEDLGVDRDVVKRLNDWAEENLKNFRYGMRLRQPAWQRYGYAFDQNDLDEAIRWALGRYNEINPEIVITTVDLSADGREVDISSITDYIDVLQVWWDYDSSDPGYPPKWRNFKVWPGDILYIDSDAEPQSGETVRIWYTRLRAINGLDGASATTLPDQDEQLILAGAAAMAAQERVQEQTQRYIPRKLREWADARMNEFNRGLRALGRRLAAKSSGLAPTAALDRWEQRDGEW
jgi:hypothetical protein